MVAYSQLMNVSITLESTSRILDDVVSAGAREPIDPQRIFSEVAAYYDVSVRELMARNRTKKVAVARQGAMYLLIYELEMAPTSAGRLLGGRNHATVIHGAGKINGGISENSVLRQEVMAIKEASFS